MLRRRALEFVMGICLMGFWLVVVREMFSYGERMAGECLRTGGGCQSRFPSAAAALLLGGLNHGYRVAEQREKPLHISRFLGCSKVVTTKLDSSRFSSARPRAIVQASSRLVPPKVRRDVGVRVR